MSTSEATPTPTSAPRRSMLDRIEWLGNQLPEPPILFSILAGIVILLSAVGAALDWEVQPVKPVAPYLGGKRALSRHLCDRIAAVPHDLYAEPFVGMGGVFLRRSARPKHEVINDLSVDVVTLFRTAR